VSAFQWNQPHRVTLDALRDPTRGRPVNDFNPSHAPDAAGGALAVSYRPRAAASRREFRAAARARHRRRVGLTTGAAGLALITALGVSGGAFAAGHPVASASASPSAAASVGSGYDLGNGSGTSAYAYGYGPGANGYGAYGYGSSPTPTPTTTTTTDAVPATAAETAGVVTILTTLGYQSAQAAGTGIILNSDGLILTNNHVVEGSTSIQVTDELTGQTYTATVVGTDARHDVALLQLQGASGLTPASLETTDPATAGDAVTAIGNAQGTGDLVAASGTVTATGQSVTTQSEASIAGETLEGMIQVDADIVSGDSGGPLVDAEGDVVGIDTAASSGSADITGFAIPIQTALDIVAQIQRGVETDTIEIGYPGFLGVEVASGATSGATGGTADTTAGALIAGVIEGTPAADAGLTTGDTVTTVNGAPVASGDALSAVLGSMEPGESVALTWTTASGSTASATVTLVEGPAA
jgi:S1-C subfamily serine protease